MAGIFLSYYNVFSLSFVFSVLDKFAPQCSPIFFRNFVSEFSAPSSKDNAV